jgi:hypothetical protein
LLPRSAVGLEFVSYGLESSKGGYRKTELIEIGEELNTLLGVGDSFVLCGLRLCQGTQQFLHPDSFDDFLGSLLFFLLSYGFCVSCSSLTRIERVMLARSKQ